jgi:hypothetical protein
MSAMGNYTIHIAANQEYFETYKSLTALESTGIGDNAVWAMGTGTVKLAFNFNGKSTTVKLKSVLHALDAGANLISISRLDDTKGCAIFGNGHIEFYNGTSKQFGTRLKLGWLYYLNTKSKALRHMVHVVHMARTQTSDKWHKILGHVRMSSIKLLMDKEMVEGLEIDLRSSPSSSCKACKLVKQHREVFPKVSETEIHDVTDLTVLDLWGLAWVTSLSGYWYYFSFTNGRMCRTMVYFGKRKSEALEKYKEYKSFLETQTKKRLKVLRCDNGGEYINPAFDNFIQNSDMEMQTTASYLPAQNGISEHLNQTLIEWAHVMLLAWDLLIFLWPQAVAYATYITNQTPT